MNADALVDLTPLLRLALFGLALAALPLLWVGLRNRGAARQRRALTLLTLFLTFDLVLFGAFTRLTDSGLGCPDWPGCYGNASPLGAQAQIDVAQTALPSGPVTHRKAWVEMVHRYLATMVGVLILALAASTWVAAWRSRSMRRAWWPTLTLIWVCIQGAFGALTVTWKLYPAIVTLHLLGGMALLALLAAQAQADAPVLPGVSPLLRRAAWGVAALCATQIALGGWVSTNYAVLACSDFPRCHSQWWPEMDFAQGFAVVRELGMQGDGKLLSFAALTAIHYAHRLVAYALLLALAAFAWGLLATRHASLRRWAHALAALAVWQLASGLSNVLLQWPLLGAVAHTAGAAALVIVLTAWLRRSHAPRSAAARNGLAPPARAASS